MSSSTTLDTSCKELYGCNQPLYRNTQYCVLHLPSADKLTDFEEVFSKKLDAKDFDFRGVWFPAKTDFSQYPFPTPVKFENATFNGEADFHLASFNGEATFRHTTFCANARFDSATFEKPVTFRGATLRNEVTFNSAIFKQRANFRARFRGRADFSQTRFEKRAEFTNVRYKKEANFYQARFVSIARFDDAVFKQLTNFDEVRFDERVNFTASRFVRGVSFRGAIFQERVLFDAVRFRAEANFYLANFKNHVRFKRDEARPPGSLRKYRDVFCPLSPPNFREAKFDNPKLVSFHSLQLHPFWFVEVDATEFTLTNVNWNWSRIPISREIDDWKNRISEHYGQYKQRAPGAPYSLLAIACWNLAVNAEENHRYEEASNFRSLAMESRRRASFQESDSHGSQLSTKRIKRVRRYWSSRVTLSNLYRLLSGYGENVLRALLVLFLIWFVFGVIYAVILREADVAFGWRGLAYSAAVITLQKPNPPPSPGVVQVLVTLETILGTVQVALLALAIRRKFMR